MLLLRLIREFHPRKPKHMSHSNGKKPVAVNGMLNAYQSGTSEFEVGQREQQASQKSKNNYECIFKE